MWGGKYSLGSQKRQTQETFGVTINMKEDDDRGKPVNTLINRVKLYSRTKENV